MLLYLSFEVVVIVSFYFLASIAKGGQGAVQFSFIPSPNITILQSAVYRCSVNEGVSINWIVNNVNSASSFWESYINSVGITAENAGSHNKILTIPGNNTILNGTTVVCKAFGTPIGMDKIVDEIDSDTLYIQGKPSKVGMSCQYQPPYTINCIWNTPFILPGISGSLIYTVNISVVDSSDHLVTNTTSDNEYSINVAPGIYSISVVAVHIGSGDEELEGDIDTTLVNAVPTEVHFKSEISLYHSDDNEDQLLFCIVSITGLEYRPHSTVLYMESAMISSNYTIDQLNDNGGLQGWTGMADVTDMSRIKNIMAYIVIYYNGIPFKSTNVHTISTFDVIGLSVDPTNKTTHDDTAVCVYFTCVFNPLVFNPLGCNVTYLSTSEGGYSSGSLVIISTSSNGCVFLNITTYNITVYDIDYNSVSYEIKPAYRMDNIPIKLPRPLDTAVDTTTVNPSSTSHTAVSTVTHEPTNNSTIPSTKNPSESTSNRTIIIISAAVAALMIVIVALLARVVSKRWRRQWRWQCQLCGCRCRWPHQHAGQYGMSLPITNSTSTRPRLSTVSMSPSTDLPGQADLEHNDTNIDGAP